MTILDYAIIYKNARDYYDTNYWIKAYVDLHYTLTLSKASILPAQDEEWLQSLSEAVLDYWKVGEVYIGQKNNKIVYCDPIDVQTAIGGSSSDDGNNFELPDYWKKVHRHTPLFSVNKMDLYDHRGLPVAYRQMKILNKLALSGKDMEISPASFGFGDMKSTKETAAAIAKRIQFFRRKLGAALNDLWTNLNIDMYVVGATDVIAELKKFQFL